MQTAVTSLSRPTRLPVALIVLIVCIAALRLCHIHLLWADEDYHLAAAIDLLHGKIPYRDFWYDKPPLNAVYYLLIGGYAGWPLRLLDTLYVLLASFLSWRVARVCWDESVGRVAAFLTAFYLTFYLPSAVIAFAADGLMLVPHLAAILCALRKKPFWAGVCCACAFLVNAKALFVLAVCGLWLLPELPLLLLGFAIPIAISGLVAILIGAWPGYYQQVWRWGLVYARESPVARPFGVGFTRSVDWVGFHAAIALGTAWALFQIGGAYRWRSVSWIVFSFAAVCLGFRFAPHYFLQLLPPLLIAGSGGIVLAWRAYGKTVAASVGLLLVIPFIRFGPRYASLAWDNLNHRPPHWSDVALDLDSQQAAQQVLRMAHPGDTLFVWGYRPDLYVFTRLTPDGLFWDSQPLTGVPADRHLHASEAIYTGPAAENRALFSRSKPTFVIDGLSLLNPKLEPSKYPELQAWFANYKLVGKTKLCLLYRRIGRE